jgi:hypothetical protein
VSRGAVSGMRGLSAAPVADALGAIDTARILTKGRRQ